jgi:hypothetical protein
MLSDIAETPFHKYPRFRKVNHQASIANKMPEAQSMVLYSSLANELKKIRGIPWFFLFRVWQGRCFGLYSWEQQYSFILIALALLII